MTPADAFATARLATRSSKRDTSPNRSQRLANLSAVPPRGVFAAAAASSIETSMRRTKVLADVAEGVELVGEWGATDSLTKQLKQVAKLVVGNAELRSERAAYFVRQGGYDTHANMLERVASNYAALDGAVASFVGEMKSRGYWEHVAVVTTSDFGRTLTSNGVGTDHAWGGNHVLLGGDVAGARVWGSYPDELGDDAELNVGRGRLLPTLGWESMWHALAQWMDVPAARMEEVLPNLPGFAAAGKLLHGAQLFGGARRA